MEQSNPPTTVGSNAGLGLAPECDLVERLRDMSRRGHWPLIGDEAATEIESLRAALKWYADGEHFTKAQPDSWDTVSGEPQNWWCDEAGTAMIEDGTLAGMVLAGKLTGAQLGALEDGEVLKA